MTKEELSEISMGIIVHAGAAKSILMEILMLAEKSEYSKIDKMFEEANDQIIKANKIHFKAVEEDYKGGLKMDVLFIHSEDQFLSTQMFQSTVQAMVNLHKKMDKVK